MNRVFMSSIFAGVGTAVMRFRSDREAFLPLIAVRRLQHQPLTVKVLGFLGLFVLAAGLDLVLDPTLSLFILYLVPTLYAAWFLGTRWGYTSCLASALVWTVDDWGGSVFYRHPLISYWNLTEKFIVLMIIVAIVSTLKGALEEEYESERRRVQREFEIAREVQMHLLPSHTPAHPRLDLGFFYQPAQVVGGDYYDLIPFGSGHMGLAVGDVSGKGLASALLMASLQGLVRTSLAIREGEVARVVTEMNLSLHELTDSARFATLFFALVDLSSQTLQYVNAGHNPPLLFRNASSSAPSLSMPEKLACGGPPVGIFPQSQYRSGHILLHDGDVLVAFTDGVIEAQNPQQEEFGEDRLRNIVHASLSLTAAQICERIREPLQAFVAESPQSDDITLVVMKVKPESVDLD
jgi:serine phosphatase RsbU (regulator of sigma subunit)